MGLVGSENRSTRRPEKSLNVYLEEMALQHHRLALKEGQIDVDHWRAHSVGYCLCPYTHISFFTFCGHDGIAVIHFKSCISVFGFLHLLC